MRKYHALLLSVLLVASGISCGCARPATSPTATQPSPTTGTSAATTPATGTASPTSAAPSQPPTATTAAPSASATTVVPVVQTTATKISLPPGVLSPSQIEASLVGREVTVQGEVLQLIENPGGQGGAYVKLGDGKGTVGFRMEQADWDALGTAGRAQYQTGKTVTVKGLLVLAGQELVVVFGKAPPASATAPAGNATFVVMVPGNTTVSYAVFMELVNEQRQLLGFVKMEQRDAVTWSVSIPAGPSKFGYRYSRDGIGFATAEEFSPDSAQTFRWPTPSPGATINDTVARWRWVPPPGFTMPSVPSAAATAAIAPRVNGEEFQGGYGFVDFWWGNFHDLAYGTSVAMKQANGGWIKIAPPVGFSQVEPLPRMNWDIVPDNPIYPAGELEYHIAQAQRAGLNVFLVPQCGILNGSLVLDADKQYSSAWWDAYCGEMERYATYFADLAERCGVKCLAFQDNEMWNSLKAPADIQERYAAYIANIRQHYHGRLGMVWSLGGSYTAPADLYPVGYFPEKFDFLAVGGPHKLTGSREPTVAEIKANFQQIVTAALAPLYAQHKKPIVLYSVGYPSIDGGVSGDFAHDDPAMDVFEAYSDKYQLDLVEQAEAFEAILQVVAETPYITGFYPFNSHWATSLPVSKLYAVWGKPAEQVIAGWYGRFAGAGK